MQNVIAGNDVRIKNIGFFRQEREDGRGIGVQFFCKIFNAENCEFQFVGIDFFLCHKTLLSNLRFFGTDFRIALYFS